MIVEVCEVVPVATRMPEFPSIVHMPTPKRDHYCSYTIFGVTAYYYKNENTI